MGIDGMKLIRWITSDCGTVRLGRPDRNGALRGYVQACRKPRPTGAAIVVLGRKCRRERRAERRNRSASRAGDRTLRGRGGAGPGGDRRTSGQAADAPVAEAMRDYGHRGRSAGRRDPGRERLAFDTAERALHRRYRRTRQGRADHLVTHRYHLPRANASFRWAGFENVINVAADPDGRFRRSARALLWESVKWPMNVLRAAAASAAMAGDVPRENYMKYLE